MKNNCLEIGMIQAFLDCELEQGETMRVSRHIATCDTCSMMLAEAEDESAIVFPALEREFNTLVPTQRLWNKINDSTEREARPFWQKAWGFLAVSLASPSLAGAAVLVIVIGIFAAVWMNRTPVSVVTSPTDSMARATAPQTAVPVPAVTKSITGGDQVTEPSLRRSEKFEQTSYRPENRRITATPGIVKTPANSDVYMPGEDSYVKTIASMTKTVDAQKDTVLRPSQRMAYERDMAVVNDSIAKMRTEVKRNPKNEAAKQVLYSSYQNKIDLLNSVSQKEELVASLR